MRKTASALIAVLIWSVGLQLPGYAQVEKNVPLIPHALVPERRIIIDHSQKSPEWKVLWDRAREQASAGRIDTAIQLYIDLLAKKNSLEVARWELARLLTHTRKWPEAAGQLEMLVEGSPRNLEYLKALGQVVWERGYYDRAVDLFGRVLEKNPADRDALAGLVEGLIKLERKKEALPLLERLYLMQPDNLGVKRYLAQLSYEIGEDEKSRVYLRGLADQKNADTDIIEIAAIVNERLGRFKEAVEYWQRVLEREPGHHQALVSLSRYFEEKAHTRPALEHLLSLLENDPNNSSLLLRVGHLYRKNGQHGKAVSYFESYLAQKPDDKEVQQLVIDSHAALGAKDAALVALERYFRESTNPADSEHLLMTAELYDTAGRYHEAIALYQRVLEMKPGNPEILAALVNDQTMTGDDEGALRTWRQLLAVSKEPLPIYRSMAAILDRLGEKKELVETLKIIHEMDPADGEVLLDLATRAFREDEYEDAQIYFARLEKLGHRSLIFFEGQGVIFARNGELYKAIKNFDEALRLDPSRQDLRLEVIRMAGTLGMISLANEHIDHIGRHAWQDERKADSYTMELVRAEALLNTGYFFQALEIYTRIESEVVSPVFRNELGLSIAALYAKADLPYEAEQKLRQVLISSIDREPVLSALFELSLANGRTADAEVWLNALTLLSEGKVNPPTGYLHRLHLKQARLASAKNELRRALKICNSLYSELTDTGQSELRLETGILLGQLLLQADKLEEANEVVRSLSADGFEPMAVAVLRRQILLKEGRKASADELSRSLAGRARNIDPSALIRLADYYSKYTDTEGATSVALILAELIPHSIKSGFLMAEAKEHQGRLTEALDELKKLAAAFPENTKLLVNTARLTFMTGSYAESLEICEKLLSHAYRRPDILLLKARVLWAQNNTSEALALYRDFLNPPVDSMLAVKMQEAGILIDLPPKPSFWNKVSFTSGNPPRITELLMSPEHVLAVDETKAVINDLATPLYALSRWQERFSRELGIRSAVQDREYHSAVTRFEKLVAEYGMDESLYFDLAGIYNRAGKITEEASIYQGMLRTPPAYSAGESLHDRNVFKKRPLVSLGGGYSEEEGWNSHLGVRKVWQEAEVLVAPRIQDEMTVSLSRTRYQSPDNTLRTRSKMAFLSYRAGIVKELTMQLGGGVNELNNDRHGPIGIFSGRLSGEAWEKVRGHIAFRRDITDDTVASLTRNIMFNEGSAGVSMEMLPSLTLGGKIGRKNYSDENQKNWYELWSTYIILPEPRRLALTYGFDFQDSDEEHQTLIFGSDGFSPDDHPYWSPRNYWRNRIGLSFTHQLGIESLERDFPTYYTLHYTLGHDSRGYDLQEFAGNLFMELTSSFLVKASADFFHTKGARSKGLALSAIYRW